MTWPGGATSHYPLTLLRRLSPSAETRELREQLARNPLTVLPHRPADSGPLRARSAELVGNYALRIHFSDGHSTGIYSWSYLREIASEREVTQSDPAEAPPTVSAREPRHER